MGTLFTAWKSAPLEAEFGINKQICMALPFLKCEGFGVKELYYFLKIPLVI